MRNALSWTETQTWTLLQRIFLFPFFLPPVWTKRRMWGDFATFFHFFVQSASTYLRPGCWNMFTAVHNGSQLLPFMQFQLMYFFPSLHRHQSGAPVSASWTVTAEEMLAEGVCVCACVWVCAVCAGLDRSPALGIFVMINTSLHTFYLSMPWRLEEGVGSLLRRFGL